MKGSSRIALDAAPRAKLFEGTRVATWVLRQADFSPEGNKVNVQRESVFRRNLALESIFITR